MMVGLRWQRGGGDTRVEGFTCVLMQKTKKSTGTAVVRLSESIFINVHGVFQRKEQVFVTNIVLPSWSIVSFFEAKMWKRLSSWESSQILFVVFASCCGFWPYAVGFRETALEQSPLRQSLNEQLINGQGSIFALALLVPLFFDWLADLFVNFMNRKKKDTSSEDMVTDFEKALLFVSLAGAPCLAFVSCDSLALLWFCLTRFQVVAVLGTFRVCLSRYDSRVWSWWSTIFSITIVTVALNLTTWTSMTNNNGGSIAILATTLKALALSLNFFQSGLFLLRQFYTFIHYGVKRNNTTTMLLTGTKKSKSKVEPSNGPTPSSGNGDEIHKFMEKMFFPILFVSVELVSHFIVVMSFIVLGSASQFHPENLLIYKSAFIIVEIGLLYYYMRKIKYESLYNLQALVEARKQYLRYIAHEMRTPLNSAVLGLKLICDSLATIENKGNPPTSTLPQSNSNPYHYLDLNHFAVFSTIPILPFLKQMIWILNYLRLLVMCPKPLRLRWKSWPIS